ncbi:hypothetical protein ACJMK2_004575, partial [Sinanodonta woodiana]
MGNIVQVEYTIEVPHSTESEEKPPEEKKKLTKEEVKKENIFKDLNKAIDQINQNKDLEINNEKWNRDLLKSLANYSDCTPEVTKDIAREKKFLENIRNILTSHMKKETKEEDERVAKWCLAIYYNTSIMDSNIPRLRSLDIVPVFISFLDAQVEISRLTALSTLANIIDEKESTEVLQGKPDVIVILLQNLSLALDDPHHKHLDWSAQKCAR